MQALGIQEKEKCLPSGKRGAALGPCTPFIFRAVPQESCGKWWISQGHLLGIQDPGPGGHWGLWVMSSQPDSLIAAPAPPVETKARLPITQLHANLP